MQQPDPEVVRRLLATDPIWTAYALADLQPDFAPYCTWSIGEVAHGEVAHRDIAQSEVVQSRDATVALIFTGLEIPTLFLSGPAGGVAAAVAQHPALPAQIYITVREEHFPLVDQLWDFSRDTRGMWRLALPQTTTLSTKSVAGLVRLTVDDSDRLRALYRHGGPFTPDAFSPYQVENGVFWGIQNQAGELLAAGGTHIVDWRHGIGAIGNMYTRPDCRGRGYAGAVLASIVNTLRAGQVETIVLNVDQRNEQARRLYEKEGFVLHCPYLEGIGQLRK